MDEPTFSVRGVPVPVQDASLPMHLQLARAVARGYKLNDNNKKHEDSNTHTQSVVGQANDTTARFFFVEVLIGCFWREVCCCAMKGRRSRV